MIGNQRLVITLKLCLQGDTKAAYSILSFGQILYLAGIVYVSYNWDRDVGFDVGRGGIIVLRACIIA